MIIISYYGIIIKRKWKFKIIIIIILSNYNIDEEVVKLLLIYIKFLIKGRKSMKLNGKVVIITGGTRGIGKGIAIEAAKEGAILVLNYISDDKSAIETQTEIRNMGAYCMLLKGDVSKKDVAKELVEKCIKECGKVDVLVNNAAISKIGLFMDATEEDYDYIMNTNFKSVFNMTRAVITHMLSRGSGNIINISSVWGENGASCEVLYSASKGAINSFTKALSKEVGLSGIRVNAVAPGVIETKMNGWMSTEERDELQEEISLGRFGTVEEIGKSVVFLASDESSYITGHILNVNGGF